MVFISKDSRYRSLYNLPDLVTFSASLPELELDPGEELRREGGKRGGREKGRRGRKERRGERREKEERKFHDTYLTQ